MTNTFRALLLLSNGLKIFKKFFVGPRSGTYYLDREKKIYVQRVGWGYRNRKASVSYDIYKVGGI